MAKGAGCEDLEGKDSRDERVASELCVSHVHAGFAGDATAVKMLLHLVACSSLFFTEDGIN